MRDFDLLTHLAHATPGDVQTFAKVCLMLEPAVIRTLQERAWQPDSIDEFMADCRDRAAGIERQGSDRGDGR